MREIKFRAWHKTEQVMFEVGGFDNMDYDIDNKYRYVTVAGEDCGIVEPTPQIQTLEIMQYTGLKDINGVEIYEGDIVTTYSEFLKENVGTQVIEWDRVGFSPIPDEKYIEILGNIYEHPELLK